MLDVQSPKAFLLETLWKLCDATEFSTLAHSKGLTMRSLDPDLFHPNSSEFFQKLEARAYKLKQIPPITPVLFYFPQSALENLGEASGRIISELQRYRLWLRLQRFSFFFFGCKDSWNLLVTFIVKYWHLSIARS